MIRIKFPCKINDIMLWNDRDIIRKVKVTDIHYKMAQNIFEVHFRYKENGQQRLSFEYYDKGRLKMYRESE